MLESLSIRAFRLIPSLDLHVRPGLTILSGETGAGKSILLEALGLALGERAESNMVREEAQEACITAVFTPPKSHAIWAFLQEQGVDATEAEPLILKRILKKDGGSRSFFQDQPATLQRLRQIGSFLIDIHGQFDRILVVSDQTRFLDRYGNCQDIQAKTAETYACWKQAVEDYERLRQQQDHAGQQKAFLVYCLAELQQAAPFPSGEEEALLQKRQQIQQQGKSAETLQELSRLLEEPGGLQHLLSQFQRQAQRLASFAGREAAALQKASENLFIELEETEQALVAFRHHLQEDASLSVETLDDRLHTLRALAKKHQVSVQALGEVQETFRAQLHLLEDSAFQEAALRQAIEQTKLVYEEQATLLYQKRLEAARRLEANVQQQLPELKLSQASFFIQDAALPEEQYGPQGMHRFSFWIQTNQGSPPGMLHQVASGGELSRFLLILKSALMSCQDTGTLIFDEIESGTGGAVAQAIGAKLKELSKSTQVLAITHSPQIAVYADQHWKIEKKLLEGTTVYTEVVPLSQEAHVEEVSRMLSGEIITSAARAAALDLKQGALGERSAS
ncbi:MAG: DNA repair protein RecN [Alphaproteobacteria bacterium]